MANKTRPVEMQIAWEPYEESFIKEIKVDLTDELIEKICENGLDTLNETIFKDQDCYALFEDIRSSFDAEHADDPDYQAYLQTITIPNYVPTYTDWLEDCDMPFDIIISDLVYKYCEKILNYKVDCYLGPNYLGTVKLPYSTNTLDILSLIDCCLDGKTVDEVERLSSFKEKISFLTRLQIRNSGEYVNTIIDAMNFKVWIPEEIENLALDFGEPVTKQPEISEQEIIIVDAVDGPVKRVGNNKSEEKPEEKAPEKSAEEKTEEKSPVKPVEKPVKTVAEKPQNKETAEPKKKTDIKPEKRVEVKKKTKKVSPVKLIALVLLAVIIAAGVFVYKEYYVSKSPMHFDAKQLASVKIDGYYDVFDITLDNPDDWYYIVNNLGYWKYFKIFNPSKVNEDSEDIISVTFYDKNGKKLEEITCYDRDMVSIDGVLCRPDIPTSENLALPDLLKTFGERYMKEALRPEIEKMMKRAKIENGHVTIDMIDIPFANGAYRKIWGARTDYKTGKQKTRVLFDKSGQEYKYIPGNKLLIPLKEFLDGEKLYDMWLSIEACGISFGYDISELIPKELRAK